MRKLLNSELNRKSVDDFKKADKLPIVIVLDNVRSMNNIGSVFRTADAFLINSIYLCGITATPPHRDIQKTALGATDSVNWRYFEETKLAISDLKKEGFKVYSLEQVEGSISLFEFTPDPDDKIAFVFGHEIKGVAQEIINISDHSIEIPQLGTKHSFNISVSTGIVLWDYYCKIKQKK